MTGEVRRDEAKERGVISVISVQKISLITFIIYELDDSS
jgi:hypothetical protein